MNEFILKRGNILNAQHLPPKLVQFVCCRLSPTQTQIYDAILNGKDMRHIREGIQTDTLGILRQLINVCRYGSFLKFVFMTMIFILALFLAIRA